METLCHVSARLSPSALFPQVAIARTMRAIPAPCVLAGMREDPAVAIDAVSPRSRRALLAAALGAAGATVASVVGRPLPVRGASAAVMTETTNYAADTTSLSTTLGTALVVTSSSASGLHATCTNMAGIGDTYGVNAGAWGPWGTGVRASASSATGVTTGVYATASSPAGTGVVAEVPAATGNTVGIDVRAVSPTSIGIRANGATGIHVSTGVVGYPPDPIPGVAVQAYAAASDGSIAVLATSPDGVGAKGVSETNVGVSGESGTGAGVRGTSAGGIGVYGASAKVDGVAGVSTEGAGVSGASSEYHGVRGTTSAVAGAGVYGEAGSGATGVYGYSGTMPPAALAKTGVYGYAAQDATACGVRGKTASGRGVYGEATTGYGVRGFAEGGTALYGATGGPKKGYGLRALGRIRFDHCAGIATIGAGTKSVSIAPGTDLASTSAVTATLMGSAGGTTTVHRCVVNATTDTFTIYLTANATQNVKVAWHVFG